MDKKSLQEMFDSAVHIGHRTHKWNPRMKKFIHTEKNGIHIINLEKTAEYLQAALDFVGRLTAEGKNILFVSTKPQSISLLEAAANDCHMPYVVAKWIPGLLTNFSTVKVRIKYLADLKDQKMTGEFEKYTKKEASKLTKDIDKLEMTLGGVQNMNSKPDAVFVVDVVRDNIVVKEAKKLGIPVVGIVDTNADPDPIDYPIPGNDDALRSLEYFVGSVCDAIKKSRKAKA